LPRTGTTSVDKKKMSEGLANTKALLWSPHKDDEFLVADRGLHLFSVQTQSITEACQVAGCTFLSRREDATSVATVSASSESAAPPAPEDGDTQDTVKYQLKSSITSLAQLMTDSSFHIAWSFDPLDPNLVAISFPSRGQLRLVRFDDPDFNHMLTVPQAIFPSGSISFGALAFNPVYPELLCCVVTSTKAPHQSRLVVWDVAQDVQQDSQRTQQSSFQTRSKGRPTTDISRWVTPKVQARHDPIACSDFLPSSSMSTMVSALTWLPHDPHSVAYVLSPRVDPALQLIDRQALAPEIRFVDFRETPPLQVRFPGYGLTPVAQSDSLPPAPYAQILPSPHLPFLLAVGHAASHQVYLYDTRAMRYTSTSPPLAPIAILTPYTSVQSAPERQATMSHPKIGASSEIVRLLWASGQHGLLAATYLGSSDAILWDLQQDLALDRPGTSSENPPPQLHEPHHGSIHVHHSIPPSQLWSALDPLPVKNLSKSDVPARLSRPVIDFANDEALKQFPALKSHLDIELNLGKLALRTARAVRRATFTQCYIDILETSLINAQQGAQEYLPIAKLLSKGFDAVKRVREQRVDSAASSENEDSLLTGGLGEAYQALVDFFTEEINFYVARQKASSMKSSGPQQDVPRDIDSAYELLHKAFDPHSSDPAAASKAIYACLAKTALWVARTQANRQTEATTDVDDTLAEAEIAHLTLAQIKLLRALRRCRSGKDLLVERTSSLNRQFVTSLDSPWGLLTLAYAEALTLPCTLCDWTRTPPSMLTVLESAMRRTKSPTKMPSQTEAVDGQDSEQKERDGKRSSTPGTTPATSPAHAATTQSQGPRDRHEDHESVIRFPLRFTETSRLPILTPQDADLYADRLSVLIPAARQSVSANAPWSDNTVLVLASSLSPDTPDRPLALLVSKFRSPTVASLASSSRVPFMLCSGRLDSPGLCISSLVTAGNAAESNSEGQWLRYLQRRHSKHVHHLITVATQDIVNELESCFASALVGGSSSMESFDTIAEDIRLNQLLRTIVDETTTILATDATTLITSRVRNDYGITPQRSLHALDLEFVRFAGMTAQTSVFLYSILELRKKVLTEALREFVRHYLDQAHHLPEVHDSVQQDDEAWWVDDFDRIARGHSIEDTGVGAIWNAIGSETAGGSLGVPSRPAVVTSVLNLLKRCDYLWTKFTNGLAQELVNGLEATATRLNLRTLRLVWSYLLQTHQQASTDVRQSAMVCDPSQFTPTEFETGSRASYNFVMSELRGEGNSAVWTRVPCERMLLDPNSNDAMIGMGSSDPVDALANADLESSRFAQLALHHHYYQNAPCLARQETTRNTSTAAYAESYFRDEVILRSAAIASSVTSNQSDEANKRETLLEALRSLGHPDAHVLISQTQCVPLTQFAQFVSESDAPGRTATGLVRFANFEPVQWPSKMKQSEHTQLPLLLQVQQDQLALHLKIFRSHFAGYIHDLAPLDPSCPYFQTPSALFLPRSATPSHHPFEALTLPVYVSLPRCRLMRRLGWPLAHSIMLSPKDSGHSDCKIAWNTYTRQRFPILESLENDKMPSIPCGMDSIDDINALRKKIDTLGASDPDRAAFLAACYNDIEYGLEVLKSYGTSSEYANLVDTVQRVLARRKVGPDAHQSHDNAPLAERAWSVTEVFNSLVSPFLNSGLVQLPSTDLGGTTRNRPYLSAFLHLAKLDPGFLAEALNALPGDVKVAATNLHEHPDYGPLMLVALDAVLHNQQLHIDDRVALAVRVLPDCALLAYVARVAAEAIQQGDLSALGVIGLVHSLPDYVVEGAMNAARLEAYLSGICSQRMDDSAISSSVLDVLRRVVKDARPKTEKFVEKDAIRYSHGSVGSVLRALSFMQITAVDGSTRCKLDLPFPFKSFGSSSNQQSNLSIELNFQRNGPARRHRFHPNAAAEVIAPARAVESDLLFVDSIYAATLGQIQAGSQSGGDGLLPLLTTDGFSHTAMSFGAASPVAALLLLRKYLDNTGDIATVAALAAYVIALLPAHAGPQGMVTSLPVVTPIPSDQVYFLTSTLAPTGNLDAVKIDVPTRAVSPFPHSLAKGSQSTSVVGDVPGVTQTIDFLVTEAVRIAQAAPTLGQATSMNLGIRSTVGHRLSLGYLPPSSMASPYAPFYVANARSEALGFEFIYHYQQLLNRLGLTIERARFDVARSKLVRIFSNNQVSLCAVKQAPSAQLTALNRRPVYGGGISAPPRVMTRNRVGSNTEADGGINNPELTSVLNLSSNATPSLACVGQVDESKALEMLSQLTTADSVVSTSETKASKARLTSMPICGVSNSAAVVNSSLVVGVYPRCQTCASSMLPKQGAANGAVLPYADMSFQEAQAQVELALKYQQAPVGLQHQLMVDPQAPSSSQDSKVAQTPMRGSRLTSRGGSHFGGGGFKPGQKAPQKGLAAETPKGQNAGQQTSQPDDQRGPDATPGTSAAATAAAGGSISGLRGKVADQSGAPSPKAPYPSGIPGHPTSSLVPTTGISPTVPQDPAAAIAYAMKNGCPTCGKPAPRCAVCLCSISQPLQPNELPDLLKSNKISTAKRLLDLLDVNDRSMVRTAAGDQRLENESRKWWNLSIAWCHGCGHGGHSAHLAAWFAQNVVCPVAECPCRCADLHQMAKPFYNLYNRVVE